MQRHSSFTLAISCFAVFCLVGIQACPAWGPTDWFGASEESTQVGTPAWWKKHKKTAVFVPGEGFQVEGVAGYFDDQGRPIQTSVAKVVKEKKNKGLLNDIHVVEQVDGIKSQFGMGADATLAQQSYSLGEDFFRRQEYSKAAKAFKEAIARGPDTQIEQDALFYQAESNFFDKKYSKAIGLYDELLDKYPNSLHLDKVIRRQFDIARYWEQYHDYDPNWVTTPNFIDDTRPLFDTIGHAIKTYENIRLKDPTGPLADAAVMTTANSYFLRGRFNDADYQYKLLREEYPQSKYQFEAHILGLQCKLRIYQGPNYDGGPLEDAKKLVKQLKQQFAGELSQEERERLATIQAQLNEALAERDFAIATYYDETEHFGSAKFYYAKVARDYPESTLGTKSRERYGEIAGEPDHPETQVGWFLSLFPENRERKTLQQVPLLAPESEISIATRPEAGLSDGNSILR
ncbi:tetratricopeptide repeat protein [Bythopirellula polymerisocia]|uniref:Outer membrane protein assembly factor BamD n=1 Tax=Bythopirellula polymerisocia TaxID=2528003 RepID=A0A5C6CVP2_9BACT|nr:outer membrane protein assembly factor BamD [Bythopirellula polymerisocia]TWU28518.1 Outer membrane protein assembly factor BamD [Bythopirellula polymerisocia]